jgi:peroxin-7
VRRLKADPHQPDAFATCSYDMSCSLWRLQEPVPTHSFTRHSEFVTGVDFNLHLKGVIATCAWDRTVNVWRA